MHFAIYIAIAAFLALILYQNTLAKYSKFDIIAPIYDIMMKSTEKNTLGPYRAEYVKQIGQNNHTLDLAVGTGPNIEYYPENARVTLVDASQDMLTKAKAKSMSRNDCSFAFERARLENLPFEDGTFDSVLSIDVFCSVLDQEKAMRECFRVLRSGGRFIFVEHFKTYNFWKDLGMYLVTGIILPLVGSSMVRETDKTIRTIAKDGTIEIEEEKKLGSSFRYILVKKL